jgi:hypothetical protein
MYIEIKIDDSIFISSVFRRYYNPKTLNMDDLEEDIRRFGFLKKLFKRYKKTGNINCNLSVNHIIILGNSIVPEKVCSMLLIYFLREYLDTLKTFMLALGRWDGDDIFMNGQMIHDDEILIDNILLEKINKNFRNNREEL